MNAPNMPPLYFPNVTDWRALHYNPRFCRDILQPLITSMRRNAIELMQMAHLTRRAGHLLKTADQHLARTCSTPGPEPRCCADITPTSITLIYGGAPCCPAMSGTYGLTPGNWYWPDFPESYPCHYSHTKNFPAGNCETGCQTFNPGGGQPIQYFFPGFLGLIADTSNSDYIPVPPFPISAIVTTYFYEYRIANSVCTLQQYSLGTEWSLGGTNGPCEQPNGTPGYASAFWGNMTPCATPTITIALA